MERYRPSVNSDAWREVPDPASGLWFDLGPHLLDQAFVLFGYPESITADIRAERDGAVVPDAFDVLLHYPNLRVQLGSNLLSRITAPRFRLNGTKGSFLKYGVDPQEDALKAGARPSQKDWGAESPEAWGKLAIASDNHVKETRVPTEKGNYTAFYENVRDVIASGAPAENSLPQALNLMRALELAVQSSREQRTVPFSGIK
jgi:scyllo-inositol 2-dehydrogenase (NADP+)